MNPKIIEKLEKISIRITQSIGSVESLLLHTTLFIISFLLYFFGIDFTSILLVLTTIVSLEAIYLSVFIQMSVNFQSKKLEDIQENVEEIQEDVEEIQEDVEEIQEDVEEINDDEDDDEDDEQIKEIKQTIDKLLKEVLSLKRQQKKPPKSSE